MRILVVDDEPAVREALAARAQADDALTGPRRPTARRARA
jgi:hypothetical protein